jgi:spore germination cell wall hydrolase CwlJ-like protein
LLIKNFVTVALLSLTAFTFTPVVAKAEAANVKTAKVVHKCTKQYNDKILLACAIYAEGRGLGKKGMNAVGNVVINRRNDTYFPNTVRGVLFQKGQFSYAKTFNVTEKDKWQEAKAIAERLLYLEKHFPELRSVLDVTKGALYFKKRNIRTHWERDMRLVYRDKVHGFYLPKGS